jgi:hypothetical protein
MATPAVNPVTAGKKTANTVSNGSEPSENHRVTELAAWPAGGEPRKSDTRDRPMAARTTYCTRSASEVL